MATLVSGRLVTDGTGRLFIHPTDDNDDVISTLHAVDDDGVAVDELAVDMVEVAWSEDDGGFIEVMPGEDSHNERHHERDVDISGTTGPLFDEDGNLVIPGDPHHSEPLPNDPHYDPTAPNKTSAQTNSDEENPTMTGHTEAYA